MASSENNNNNKLEKDDNNNMDDIYEEDDEEISEELLDRPQIEQDNDVFEEDEEEEEEDEDLNSVSSSADPIIVTVALPPPTTAAAADPPPSSSDRKPQPLDMESRKLFQRLWTDEDEIELLRGFLHYSSQRGTSQHHHQDTAVFYDQIRSKLQLDFNKNQLVEKLRRLKKKYRNVVARTAAGKDFAFKSPHDQQTYEISRRIWGIGGGGIDDEEPNPNAVNYNLINQHQHLINHEGGGIDLNTTTSMDSKKVQRSRKRSRVKVEEKATPPPPPVSFSIPAGSVEETVKSCLTPLFKELMNNAINGPCGFGGGMLSPIPMNFGGGNFSVDKKWRKQQILELEVYSKRLELVQDQIKSTLEELRSLES